MPLMPHTRKLFDGPDDPSLPEDIQSLPVADRTTYVEAWNTQFNECMENEDASEGFCENQANIVAGAAISDSSETIQRFFNPKPKHGRTGKPTI